MLISTPTPKLGVDPDAATFTKSSHTTVNECVEVAHVDGGVLVRDSKNPGGAVLEFNDAEWQAFGRGMVGGEFGDFA